MKDILQAEIARHYQEDKRARTTARSQQTPKHTYVAASALWSLGVKAFLFLGTAFAQPRFEYRAQILGLHQQFSHISWKIDYPDHTEKIAQSYMPAVFDFAVSGNSQVLVSTAGLWSNAILPADYSMNGVTDTQVRFAQRFSERWQIGAGLNLPTGNSKLDYNQNVVANRLTESILGFPLQRLGAGTDLEFSLAHALNVSETLGLGFGSSFMLPGTFEFRQQQADTYTPGARYILSTTLNHIGATVPWQISVLAQFYGPDQLNRRDFFRQGWQLEPSLGWDWKFSRQWKLGGNLRHIWKDDNEILGSPGNVQPPEHFYIDNSTYALLALNRDWSRRVRAGLQLGWNHFGDSNQQLSRATIWRWRLHAVLKISEHFILNAGGDYASGRAERGTIALRGYGAAISLAARY